jgi:hypothetical protein
VGRTQNCWMLNLAVHIVTTGLQRVKSVIKTSELMLYREIIAVCSEIHTKHINTLCGQNVNCCMLNLAVHIVTTGAVKGYIHIWECKSVLLHRTNRQYCHLRLMLVITNFFKNVTPCCFQELCVWRLYSLRLETAGPASSELLRRRTIKFQDWRYGASCCLFLLVRVLTARD